MKIQLKETIEKPIEVDVDFPIYSKNEVDIDYHPSSIYYMKVFLGDDGDVYRRTVVIHGDGSIEFNQERYNIALANASLDYKLGRCRYKCSQSEYAKALSEAKNLIDEAINQEEIEKMHIKTPTP